MKRFHLNIALMILLGLVIGLSCEERPVDPGHSNPFDSENPDGQGDPYNLSAEIAQGGIQLTWAQVTNPQPEGYNLYRSVNDDVFVLYQELEQTGSFTDTDIVNGKRYEYFIVATVSNGEASSSNIVSVTLNTDPIIVIESESTTHTATCTVNLTIIAHGAGSMQIANTFEDIPGSQLLDFDNDKVWELPAGRGDKVVYLQVTYSDGGTSPVVSDTIEPAPLFPAIEIMDVQEISGLNYVDNPNITLSMPGAGAFDMLLSHTSDSIGIQWQTYSESLPFTLSDDDGWRYVYAWFRHDFFAEGAVVDSVIVDMHCEIESFDWTSTGVDTLAPGDTVNFTLIALEESFGPETDGTAEVIVEGITDPIPMSDLGDGTYSAIYIVNGHTRQFIDAAVTATLIDRLGNTAEPSTASPFSGSGYLAGTEKRFSLGEGELITMIWIPSGEFAMGSYSGEEDASEDEEPQHTVTFAQGFWLGKFEMNQRQWESVTGENPSGFIGDNLPVENISWDAAMEFIDEINLAEEQEVWRLPSEAEWEYACRGGTETRFHWGDDPGYSDVDEYGWYSVNSGFETHDPGLLYSNSLDIYDMHGNVWEWCADMYHYDYTGAPDNGSAWIDWDVRNRVMRGGSWFNSASDLRSASRSYADPEFTSSSVGVRLARTEPE